MPLGEVWAYSPEPPKSFKTVIRQLVNCTGGDGNYLLSIGCKPDGSIADTDAVRIEEVGEWLTQYGESIYATRGGIWKPTADYAASYRGNVVYLHLLQDTERIERTFPFTKNTLCTFTCLTDEQAEIKAENGLLKVCVSGKPEESADVILKLTLAAPAVMEE